MTATSVATHPTCRVCWNPVIGPPLLTPSDPMLPVCRDCERRWVAGDKPLHPRQCPVCRGKGKRMVAPDAPAPDPVLEQQPVVEAEGSAPLGEKQRQKLKKEQESARKKSEREQKKRQKEQKKLLSKVSAACDRCNGLGKVPQVSGLSAEAPFRPTSEYVR